MNKAPKKILLHRKRAELELQYADNTYTLSAEFLRVHSPSAEVQGHSPDQKKVPINKKNVQITGIEAQGNYAIKLIFDDSHDSGIYTWEYLRSLAKEQNQLWNTYLKDAEVEYQKRDGESVLKWTE